MPFVLDPSIALVWGFDDEASPYADQVLQRLSSDPAIVPVIWPLELANGLVSGERRGRIDSAGRTRFVTLIDSLRIEVESSPLEHALDAVVAVALTYGLTSYDASYLELAMRRGLPLATHDARLSDAATRAGVPLYLQ